jgi:putative heme-binding domain-containing protein
VRHARRLLQEKAAQRKIEQDARQEIVSAFHARNQSSRRTLRALWALHAMGNQGGIAKLAQDSLNRRSANEFEGHDEHVTSWLIGLGVEEVSDHADRLAGESPRPPADSGGFTSRKFLDSLIVSAKVEKSPRVLLALAAAAPQLMKSRYRGPASLMTEALAKRELPDDPYLPQMVWYAVESLIEKNRSQVLTLLPEIKSPLVRECVARRVAGMEYGLDELLHHLSRQEPAASQADVVRGIVLALGGAARLNMPEKWPEAAKILAVLDDSDAQHNVRTLALIFGDKSVRDDLLKLVANPQADWKDRSRAIELLVTDRAEALPPLLIALLDDVKVRPAAIRGLAAFHHPDTASALLLRYPKLTPAEKEDAIQTLSSRPDWAVALLDAVKAGTIPRTEVSSLVVRQLMTLKHDGIKQKITDIWGEIKPASQQKQELAERYRRQLTDELLAKADLKNGQALFAKTCGNCHKLYGAGGTIGPELTGSQRTNLEYLLDNVLDPSAIVPREYQVTVLELQSGRVVQGIVVDETNFGLTVQTANERVAIPKDQVEARSASNLSMMPEGLFDRLSDTEVRDLVAFLKTREPLP